MSDIAIQVEDLGKLYRLGEVGTGTISHDLNRWIARMRGKEDPYARIGEVNDRTAKSKGDYVWALQDINFEVKKGEVLGIIGRNGAGKSTLLKILSKVTAPSKGRIKVNGRIASLLEVGTGFHPELTGRENIFLNGAILGMTRAEVKTKFDAIVDFSGVERYIDTPVKRYSSGMYVRLAFAVAAHLESEILIVDEVLAVGDAEFQSKCLGKMSEVSKGEGRTVLFVSHNMTSIVELCFSGLYFKNGVIAAHGLVKDVINSYMHIGVGTSFVNVSKSLSVPELLAVNIDEGQLDLGNLHLSFDFTSPFALWPPVIGIVVTNALGQPVFSSNPRMHSKNYDLSQKSTRGRMNLVIDNLPLLTGTYYISCYLGDLSTDYNTYLDILKFNFFSKSIDNSKVPDLKYVGSVNLKDSRWTLNTL